jgi:superfamily II DNA or RNA helicase
MLGLSATMNRQDGLSKVFKMFIGNVEACWKRGPQENVKVKAINYVNDDPDFSRNLRNYRGQPDYVKMISKICEYTPRTEFILSVVQDIWTKNNNQQIMIIGHRKKQLTYIHDAIKHRGFATVGYYIGGMKEKDLKITEGENIVVATYKMAEEALDIKSLTTIVMSTPKKDVRQAVGRILRKGGEKLVIDFIDQHDIFKRHWDKRRRWYNTQKFTISMTDVEGYTDDNWELVPSRKKSTKMTKVNTEPYSSLLNGKCLL